MLQVAIVLYCENDVLKKLHVKKNNLDACGFALKNLTL